MPMVSRSDEPGSWHHLVNRGVRRLPLFGSSIDRRVFLGYLRDVSRDYGIETHAFCLMDNHYHLMVCSLQGRLSQAMQSLGTRYARYFNRQHGYSGAVFQERFFSDPIRRDESLLQLSRYIHLNPLEVHPATPPSENIWSSYGCYLGLRPAPRWLQTDLVLGLANGPSSYSRFVESDLPLALPIVCGTVFEGMPDHDRLLDEIDRAVAAVFGVDLAHVVISRSGAKNPARSIAVLLATNNPSVPSERVATHYGFSSVDGARRTASRFRRSLTADPATAQLVDDLIQKLS